MTIPTLQDFQAKGWFMTQEGLDLLKSQNENLNSIEDYIQCARNKDLRLLTTKELAHDQLLGPLILQVMNIQKTKKLTAASGGLTIVFTDGQNQYTAKETLGKVDCIKPRTPPGTKYLVIKPIEIKDNVLVLGPGLLKEEGGEVKELLEKKPKQLTGRQSPTAKNEPSKRDPNKKSRKKKAPEQIPSRVPTPALSETSQKKKTRKPKPTKAKDEQLEETPIETPAVDDKKTNDRKKNKPVKRSKERNQKSKREAKQQKDVSSSTVDKLGVAENVAETTVESSPKTPAKSPEMIKETPAKSPEMMKETPAKAPETIEETVEGSTQETIAETVQETVTETTVSTSSEISPVSNNNSNKQTYPPFNNHQPYISHSQPPLTSQVPPLPPQEYYYQQGPMYIDYSMMIPVVPPMYMPPPYMQPVYYVADPSYYYPYPHYTQYYDERQYGYPYPQ